MTCDHCGKQVPAAVFCTNCGAHQGLADHGIAAQERPQHFAAHPGEHVAQPSIFTTLFPHLGHRKINEFRWALLLGFALVVVLVSTGLITAAVVVSILLVPTLYVVYLYEAQVYRDEPVVVLGATLGGGIVLGLALTIISERLIGGSLGSTGVPVVSYGVVLPVIQLVVMPLPALLLRVLPQFRDTIDGLVFGVTAGVGFALAEGVVSYWSIFSAPLTSPTRRSGSTRSRRLRCSFLPSTGALPERSQQRCGGLRARGVAAGSRSSASRSYCSQSSPSTAAVRSSPTMVWDN